MKLAIIANTGKEGTKTIVPEFVTLLEKEGFSAVLHESIRPFVDDSYDFAGTDSLFEGADMLVSFGGDGTFLQAARLSETSGLPIIGVNLGKVGFLAEVMPDEIDMIPARLKDERISVIERLAFAAETTCGKDYFALNDIVIDRNVDTRILRLTVEVGGKYAGEFHADGLIISTPTGSTAHSMAAGGPLVMPECQVFILTPICPHSLTIRPMIIDGSQDIRITVAEGLARMAVDGQSFVAVEHGEGVIVRKAQNPVRVVRFNEKTYFDILHTRLNWGVSLKLKNA